MSATEPRVNPRDALERDPDAYLADGLTLPKALAGSQAAFTIPPAAAYTVTINRRAGGASGASSTLGTIRWAAATPAATFAFTFAAQLLHGDVLEFVFPATPDANASGPMINLAGTFPIA